MHKKFPMRIFSRLFHLLPLALFVLAVSIAEGAHCADWSAMTPVPTSDTFLAVWGDASGTAFGQASSLFRYDGQWTKVGDTALSGESLLAFSGSSADALTAVSKKGHVFQYNGTNWSTLHSPTDQTLNHACMLGPNAIVGMNSYGMYGYLPGRIAEIYLFDGSSWQEIYNDDYWCDLYSPCQEADQFYKAVWASSTTDIWAGGYRLIHYDGSGWSPVDNADLYDITGIWGTSGTSVYVATTHGIYAYDGSQWTKTGADDTIAWQALHGSAADNVCAVGDNGQTVRYDGSSWATTASPANQTLRAVWAAGSQAVYAGGDHGAFLEGNGTTWVARNSFVTDAAFIDVWAWSPNAVYALTTTALYHFDGTQWTDTAVSLPAQARAIWGSGPQDIYVAGDSGMLLRYDGTAWSQLSTGLPSESFSDLWGMAPGRVLAKGTSIIAYDQKTGVTSLAPGTPYTFSGTLSGTSTSTLMGLANNASGMPYIVQLDGAEFQSVYALPTDSPYPSYDQLFYMASWTDTSGKTFLIRYLIDTTYMQPAYNEILIYDGTELHSGPTASTLTTLHGSSPNNIFVAGYNIFHYDGSAWTTEYSGSTSINAVYALNACSAYAVGDNGLILARSDPNALETPAGLTISTSGPTNALAAWQAVAGATGYRLDVARDEAFSDLVEGYADKDMGTALSCTVTGLAPDTQYYLRVRASNATCASANALGALLTGKAAGTAPVFLLLGGN